MEDNKKRNTALETVLRVAVAILQIIQLLLSILHALREPGL
jgi:hypothetical protein